MVNTDRIRKKIPSLLIDNDTNNKVGWRNFMRKRYKYSQFQKRNPEKCNSYINKIVTDLTELDKAVNSIR
jgi:hypothetical protein